MSYLKLSCAMLVHLEDHAQARRAKAAVHPIAMRRYVARLQFVSFPSNHFLQAPRSVLPVQPCGPPKYLACPLKSDDGSQVHRALNRLTGRRRSLFAFRRLQSLYQYAGVDIQRRRYLQDVMKCQVAPTSLHLSQERPVHVAVSGELLQGLMQLLAPLADASTKLGRGWRDGRRAI